MIPLLEESNLRDAQLESVATHAPPWNLEARKKTYSFQLTEGERSQDPLQKVFEESNRIRQVFQNFTVDLS